MINNDDDNDIEELISDYEHSIANGIEPFLDVDDTIDIAQYYDLRGETDKVVHVLKHGLELHPSAPEIISFLIRITLVTKGDIKKAEEYVKMINGDEHNIDFVLAHTDILIAKGQFKEADDMVDKTLANFDSEQKDDLLMEVAQMYVFADEHQQALKWLRKCIEKNSRNYLEMLGDVLTELNKREECETVYNKLLDIDAFSVDYWNSLTTAQIAQHKIRAARDSVAYALAIDPTDFQARLNKVQLLFISGSVKPARPLMDTLVEEYRNLPADKRDNDFTVCLLLNYSEVLLANGDPRTAIEYLNILKDDAEIFDANSYAIIRQLAIAYISLGNYDRALEIVREMLNDPFIDNYCSFKILEGCLLLDKGESIKASKCFLDALDKSNTTLDTIYDIGVGYYECGRYKDAFEMFNSLVEECNSKKALGYLAACYKRLDNRNEFLSTLKIACKECPEEVEKAFNQDIPLDVQPSGYYDYIMRYGDKPNTRSRRKK